MMDEGGSATLGSSMIVGSWQANHQRRIMYVRMFYSVVDVEEKYDEIV